MAGLRVGQAYGVFHRPGFGLLVSVPRSLSTQPPFATQALTEFIRGIICVVSSTVSFSNNRLFPERYMISPSVKLFSVHLLSNACNTE